VGLRCPADSLPQLLVGTLPHIEAGL